MASVRLDPRTGMPRVQVMSAQRSGYTSPAPRPYSLAPEDYNILRGGAPIGGYAYDPNLSPVPHPGYYAPGAAPASNPWAYQYMPQAGGAPGSAGSPGGPGGGGAPGAGGANVDYQSLVENDPGFRALKAQLAAGNISAAQFRKSAIQRALIAFGRTPEAGGLGLGADATGFYNEDVDQLTRDLAAKNTAERLSTTAQLDRAHTMAIQGLQNTLASRGMLESGATGVGLGLEEQRNKEETTGKTRELIDYLSGQAAAYAQHLHESKLQEASALQSTTQAYMSMAGQFGGLGGGGDGGPPQPPVPQPQPPVAGGPPQWGWTPPASTPQPTPPPPSGSTSYGGTTVAQALAALKRAYPGKTEAQLRPLLNQWISMMGG